MKKINIEQALNTGWSQFSQRPWYLFGLGLVSLLLLKLTADSSGMATVLTYILYGGFIALLLKHAAGEKIVFDDLFDLVDKRWIYFAFLGLIQGIVFGLAVAPTILLLYRFFPPDGVVPPDLLAVPVDLIMLATTVGLVAAAMFLVRWFFAALLVIDQGLRPIAALKMSAELTSGVRWQLFGYFLITLFILIAGTMFFLVGAVVAAIVVQLATIALYRDLNRPVAEVVPEGESGHHEPHHEHHEHYHG